MCTFSGFVCFLCKLGTIECNVHCGIKCAIFVAAEHLVALRRRQYNYSNILLRSVGLLASRHIAQLYATVHWRPTVTFYDVIQYLTERCTQIDFYL
jgi:hypothetical protein